MCKDGDTYRHSLSTMQAVDGGLGFCMAGELNKGTACPHREKEMHISKMALNIPGGKLFIAVFFFLNLGYKYIHNAVCVLSA